MSNEQLMRDALKTINALKARVAQLEKQLAATDAALTKARGGSTPDLGDAISKSLKGRHSKSAAHLIPGMLAAGKDRRALEALPTAERVEEIDKRRRQS